MHKIIKPCYSDYPMNKQIGRKGEQLALKFLKSRNYEILEQNFRVKQGEIDIIAEYGQKVVFIEVKTRTGTTYGLPQESVTKQKLQRLKKLARIYMSKHDYQNKCFRIDIISIQLRKSGEVAQIDHIENV